MNVFWRTFLLFLFAALFVVIAGYSDASKAREAAFADPGSLAGSAITGDSVVAEPKGDIDTGESIVNVARRTTVYFANKTNVPVEVVSVATNDDGNVKSSIISDDCSREQKIGSGSRCSIVIETTPLNPGAWTTEVLLTHKGSGRIARAKLIGKASGQYSAEKKESGFTLSTKDVKPIDFGSVDAIESKIVRSALMVNDSPETITILSIDVIAAEKGLERLDQGCVIDMELKPGESCPVTLVWKPSPGSIISTDLIIRHTGRLGFAVIPIRGTVKEKAMETTIAAGKDTSTAAKKEAGRTPTAAEEIEKLATDKIPPLTPDLFHQNIPGTSVPASASVISGEFRLIGTVGNRAILLKPDGTTEIASIGEEVHYGGDKPAKVINVMAKSVELLINGNKKLLNLTTATELTSKVAASLSKDNTSPPSAEKAKPPAPQSAVLSNQGTMGRQ